MNEKKTIALVAFLTALLILFFYFTKPDAEKKERVITPYQVETLSLEKTTYPLKISAYGTVKSSVTVSLRAEVKGRVIKKAPCFSTGCAVKKGDLLIQLDPRDYEILVEKEKANVTKARLDLKIEEGRQIVAKTEWEQLRSSISSLEISEELALRKPHLEEKKAALYSAQNQLKKALLDLARTSIFSPLDGIILSKDVAEGDIITPEKELGKLISTSAYEVQISVPLSKLYWLIPKIQSQESVPVQIFQELDQSKTLSWDGYIKALLGNLEESGRMARLIAVIPDPLKNKEKPLLIGSYVRVEIEGPEIEQVFKLPVEVLHGGDTLWLLDKDNKLQIKKITPFLIAENVVLVKEGLEVGDLVITNTIPFPVEGMQLLDKKDEK